MYVRMISAKLRRHVFSAVSHNIRIAGDLLSKDVLKFFHNLLQSADRTSAKKLVEDFDIQHGDPSIVVTERERKDRFEDRAKSQTAVFQSGTFLLQKVETKEGIKLT